jgi:predicted amidohydrolase
VDIPLAESDMKNAFLAVAACALAVPAALAPGAPPETLKIRAVSWDVGFKPASDVEWAARVVAEVRGAAADKIDVLLFPELFSWGLAPYAPKGARPAEFITQRMLGLVLPAAEAAAGPGMLLVLGTYPHQEPGWDHAFNRAAVLLDGKWRFADKLDPTQGELVEDPPILPGDKLPLFSFRGGVAAVVVCFSMEKPEVSAALKRAGVQLVLGPSETVDEDGVARVLRTASARAVELGAAVLVAPLLGEQDGSKNMGAAALFLPAQKGIDSRPRQSEIRADGIHDDDFIVPWKALLELRRQPEKHAETRPFLAPTPAFMVETDTNP